MTTALAALTAAAMLLADVGVLAQQAPTPATGLIFGRVIEATESWYRGDAYDFVAELNAGG